MKNRLDVLLMMLSGLAVALTLAVVRAQAACTAVCPAGYYQTSGSCPAVHGKCNANKCTGQITCSMSTSSGTITMNVPCSCQ